MATLTDIAVAAAINILTTFVFFLAFAVLRIQPVNDRVYFPKWYLKGLRCTPLWGGISSLHEDMEKDFASWLNQAYLVACNNSIYCSYLVLVCMIFSFYDFILNEKRWDSKRLLDSGGMPSSPAATVTALAMGIRLQEETERSEFAIAIVLAGVVMYDASGIRFHAGGQAELLNQIVCEFASGHPLASVRPLRELLGHTPVQVVAGPAQGFIVAYLMRNMD